MTDLVATSAFGPTEARAETHGPVRMIERMDIGLASLALRKGQTAPQVFGADLAAPGELGAGSIWMAPGQWMIERSDAADVDMAALVLAEAPGCSVTEQTDGWVIIDLETHASAMDSLLERLVNLPKDAVAPGCATRTLVHHMSVLVIRRAEDKLTIMAMRSMAGSAWHTLAEAASRLAG